jgi:hypothetical protein
VSAGESYDDLFVTSCNVSKMILNRHGYELALRISSMGCVFCHRVIFLSPDSCMSGPWPVYVLKLFQQAPHVLYSTLR